MDLFKLVGRIVISNEDANSAIDDTAGKAKGLSEAIDGVGTSADNTSVKAGSSGKFNATAVWLGNTLSTLSEKALDVGIKLGKIGFGFNESIESYQYQFKALLGDADAAKNLVADIQELAKVSPLGLEGLASNAVTLLTTGTELADIIPTLEMLGNLSLGDTDRMNSVVRAYTQILGKGGLMAQEMYQLGDAMVPIVEIMTKYGGERYADGTWYQAKMSDPTYKIPAEDMVKAFQAATAEGGKWHDYMLVIMDSFAGQADRLGEESKETLGAFFEPFFEMAKTDVLPNLTASLESFRLWISENKETLDKMAGAIGGLVSGGFEKLLEVFKWVTENGEAVGVALEVIGVGLAVGAAAAHPYAAAIMAIAAGLMWLASAEEAAINPFSAYTEEEIELLQQYHDAVKNANKAREEYANADGFEKAAKWDARVLAEANESEALARIQMQTNGNEMLRTYNDWISTNADAFTLDIPAVLEEGTETMIQRELSNMNFGAFLHLYPDYSNLFTYNPSNYGMVQKTVSAGRTGIDGSHASGLDYVPKDNYIARLHKGEAVLNANEASNWRNSGTDIASAMRNAVAGLQFNVVLDSGVLVGQLAPKMDAQLGTMASRKGRGN